MAENSKPRTLDDFKTEEYSELLQQICIAIIVTLLLLFIEAKRPDLKDLCRYVLPVYAAWWYQIGIFLGIQSGQLDVLKSNYPSDANTCCMMLFTKWLEGTANATWKMMFEAIDIVKMSFSIDTTTTIITATSK